MAKIKIEDLPMEKTIGGEELKRIRGGTSGGGVILNSATVGVKLVQSELEQIRAESTTGQYNFKVEIEGVTVG